MKTKHILIVAALSLLLGITIGLLVAPRPKLIDSDIKYEPLPVIDVKKDSSDLRPILAVKPDSIIYITVYRDRPASAETQSPESPRQPIIDTMASYLATVEDWNTRREYGETLFDSDTLGTATIHEVIQYNKLIERRFTYEPLQKTVTNVVQPPVRLQPYALANATNLSASLGVGLKYGKIGIHVIGGYDYKAEKPSIGGGLLVVF